MNQYKCRIFILLLFLLALAATYPTGRALTGAAPHLRPTPVLVELFTSEGCSDCPPADLVLAELAEHHLVDGAEVIAMSEHVDYWNRLGWADPFSDAQFSSRQNEYAQAFGHRDIYTPQMVVDGQVDFVGSNRAQALQAVTRAADKPKAALTITRLSLDKETLRLQVAVDPVPGLTRLDAADVFLAITEDNLVSHVERGENRGRKLAHVAVVRNLARIGKVTEGSSFAAEPVVRIARQWKAKDLKAVVFVQDNKNRHILAASGNPIGVPSQ